MIDTGRPSRLAWTTAALLAGLLAIGCDDGDPNAPTDQPTAKTFYPRQEHWPAHQVRELTDPCSLEFSNGRQTAVVLIPHATRGMYRGLRFDWSAMVAFLEVDGQTFIGRWTTDQEGQRQREYSLGTSEEFRRRRGGSSGQVFYNSGPLRFPGGQIRIGSSRYYTEGPRKGDREPIGWRTTHGSDWVEFVQQLDSEHGWGYRWVKRVEFAPDGPGFTIHHRLENTGEKAINRTHYAHNWMLIDGQPPDANTVVEFGRPVEWTGKEPQRASIDGTRVRFTAGFRGEDARPMFAKIAGQWSTKENDVRVKRTDTGAKFRIVGDWPAESMQIYATGDEICIEPNLRVTVAPGESQQWQTHYGFYPATRTRSETRPN